MKSILEYIFQHKKLVLILISILALNLFYGYDARFTIINIIWVFINLNFTKPEKQ